MKRALGVFKSSKNITAISVAVFIVTVLLLASSTYYINVCIGNEEQANADYSVCKQMGTDLADASDYLTTEVRLFAVTHSIEHFYNYWKEINDTKTRDNVITQFEERDAPDNETAYLKEAKYYSDELVKIETYSMKMVLMSEHKDASSFPDDVKLQGYVQNVLNCELPDKYKALNDEEMAAKAIDILFNHTYDNYKDSIMNPIDTFQTLINTRLEQEVKSAKKGTAFATVLLAAATVITLIATGGLLILLNKMYVIPIRKYTDCIHSADVSPERKKGTYSSIHNLAVKVVPQGSLEVIEFGTAFNMLTDTVYEELYSRKQAEEIMRRARNEAEIANQAKSIFLANMSHELRTPLNAVNGYSELLLETELSEKQESYVGGIRYSSDSLLRLINDILDFSKFESGRLILEHKDFRLEDMLKEVSCVIEILSLQKGIDFIVKCDSDIPSTLVGDELRLKQVLINLANNAVKFTEKGKVEINIGLVEIFGEKCKVKFCVSDTGTGIEKSKLYSIFQPFVQKDASVARKYGGTGLGLSICQQIVSAWDNGNNTISVESKVGKGSTFSFTLNFGISHKKINGNTCYKPIYNGNKVLVVDDNEINIQIESEMLKNCGLTVISANSGSQAVRIMNTEENIELVFMDIRMTDMDGYETAGTIRSMKCGKEVPIVALTADVLPETEERVKESGMNYYLKKPFAVSSLYVVLKKFISGYSESETTRKNYLEVASSYFSPERLMKKIGQNKAVLENILDMFLNDYKNCRNFILQLKEENNTEQTFEFIHKLKGTSGTICCSKLFDECDRFNSSLKNGLFDGIEYFIDTFEKTYTEINEYYRTLVKDNQTEELNNSRIGVLKKLLEYCKNNDFCVANYFGENISLLRRNCRSDNFINIKSAVEQLDFNKLEIYINKELNENV